MEEKRPLVIFPEYFDSNLKRSQGRKVPLNQCVKGPTLDEIFLISKKLNVIVEKCPKKYPGNWSSSNGSLLVKFTSTKASLLHKIGIGLKNLRKTD